MKILIAEDEDISRKTLSLGLQKQGFEVVETRDGDQAWQKMLEPDAPKLLVLDIMMPVMDGLELCKKIRSYYTRTQPYIIMLTAKTGKDEVVHGLEEAGANDYISKPYNFNELRARISVGLRMLEMQSSLLAEIANREKTEDRLRQVNEEYEIVFQGTQDAMFLIEVIDTETFRFIRNNRSHQIATDISLEYIKGKTPQELLGEKQGAKVAENYKHCIFSKKTINYEEVLDFPKGTRTWSTTLTPVFQNNISFIVGSAQDITERKQLEQRLEFLATTDELTGLWNRRYIIRAVESELATANRYDYSFSLLMLDIDYFKAINDQHGHDAGDQVLSYIGDVINNEIRQVDIAGRYGGEEFVVILPRTDLNGAYIMAERLRKYFYNNPLNYKYENICFTVSIGAVEYDQSVTSTDKILKIADDALYEAKNKGRNLSVTYAF